jgi:ABC-type multidrug transport system ATPase subunit
MSYAFFVHRVTKVFKKKVAVNDVSFNVPWGEFCCIAGGNGAGKTTLVKMLIGAIKPTNNLGEILVNGTNVKDLAPTEKGVFSYQPQNVYSLFTGLTVQEAIYNIALLKKIPAEEVPDQVEYQLAQFKLDDLKASAVSKLSGGERQLLALCLTFLGDAPILILDEPTNNLDFEKKQIFFRALENYKKASNENTILMITHDCGLFENIIDSMLIIDKAEIVYNGGTQELCSYLDKMVKITLKPNIDTSQEEMVGFLSGYKHYHEHGNIVAFVTENEMHGLLAAYNDALIGRFVLDVSKTSLDDKVKEFLNESVDV